MPKSGFFKDFFNYSRSERTGIIVLLIILLTVILIPLFLPEKETDNSDIEALKKKVDEFEDKLAEQLKRESDENKPFIFDPNAADSLDFCKLGFSPAQTSVILRYRNKGGVFRTASDFADIYVVSDSVFNQLKPYIQINPVKINTPVIELNTADSVDLIKLPGIGSYYAKRIIERREKLGGFATAEQLMEIKGIDEERFNQFKKQITVDNSLINKIDINAVKATDLRKHPYFDVQTVNRIIKYRKAQGKIGSLNELVNNEIITEQQAEKIKIYIKF